MESKMTLWKDKVTLQKVGVTSWKDRNVKKNMIKEKREEEYITYHTCSNENDLDMYPATMCDCSRELNSLQELRIHKVHWCKWCNSPLGELNRMMGLWIRNTPTVSRSPLLSDSVLETFLVSQEFSGPRVIW